MYFILSKRRNGPMKKKTEKTATDIATSGLLEGFFL
jgi:hypothetical protein